MLGGGLEGAQDVAGRAVPGDGLLLTVQGGQQEMPDWQAFFYFDKSSLWAPPRGPPAVIAI